MKKRNILFIAMLLCVPAVLGGCRKETAESLMKAAMENSAKAESVSGDMNMEMVMKAKESGVSMDLEMGLDMEMEMVNKTGDYHMKGDMNISFMNLSLDMEMYSLADGDVRSNYVCTGGEWTKQEEEAGDSDRANELFDFSHFIEKKNDVKLLKDTKKQGGKEVYVLETVVSGDAFEEANKMMGGMTDSAIDGMDFSELEAKLTLNIYKETKLPASVTMEVTEGLGGNATVESSGAEVSLESLVFGLRFDEYDSIDEIVVPEEALSAAETEPETEDIPGILEQEGADTNSGTEVQKNSEGDYMLVSFDGKKEIAVPEPENLVISEYAVGTGLSFSKTDSQNSYGSVYYYMEELSDYNKGNYYAESLKEDGDSYKELGYQNVEFQDTKTVKAGDFEVKYAMLNCDISESTHDTNCTAWAETKDGFVIVCSIMHSSYEEKTEWVDEKLITKLFEKIKE